MNKFVLESEIVSIKRNDSVFMDSKYHHLLDSINASIDDNDYNQQETQVQQQQQQQQQQQSSRPLSPDPTSRIDGSESDTKDLSQTRQEESETPIEATEAGSLSRTQFFSRNSAATAALGKENVLKKNFSNLSLQSMSEATRKSSTEGTNRKVSPALLKKRALERRYSSISSHKELSRVVRKAAAIFHSSTGAPSQQASENSHTIMLEASSALIASVLLPPLPPMEEPLSGPAITPVQKEPSIPKVQLVEDLLEEKGCLVVLCAKSAETHRNNNNNNNNNNMDQYSDALLLCFDVPVYRMIDMEEELDMSQKLLGISRKSIYPQFFFERLSCEEKCDHEESEDKFGIHATDDNKTKDNGDDKYTYLGGFSTVKAMLLERMAYQWRSSEKRQRNSII